MNEEENINHSTDDRSQTTENEVVSEPSNINDQPSPETMEVHKHPHHITHKNGKYFREFFKLSQIFLRF